MKLTTNYGEYNIIIVMLRDTDNMKSLIGAYAQYYKGYRSVLDWIV